MLKEALKKVDVGSLVPCKISIIGWCAILPDAMWIFVP